MLNVIVRDDPKSPEYGGINRVDNPWFFNKQMARQKK